MNYGYVRVSSRDQNVDRQMAEMYALGLRDARIFVDRESGKDFERTQYRRLMARLKRGDTVFLKSIDRLGRNYEMIIEEWSAITRRVGADIVVLDMPLLDTRTRPDNLIGRFIGDIVLQILSFVAENERACIRQRQAEGIKMAKQRGVRFGRPFVSLPANFTEILRRYDCRELSGKEAIFLSGLPAATFYRRLKEYRRGDVPPPQN